MTRSHAAASAALLACSVLLCAASSVQAAFPSPPRLSLTFGNKSFPPQIRGWVSPDKNATVQALGRSVGAIANSSNPLNATKAAASGLELYKQRTKALILGQAGLVTYSSSVTTSPTAVSDIKCFVDPSTGQLVGLDQGGGAVSCSTAASAVVVPTSTAGYISQVKLAYTYDGAFVGRLIFELKANATAKPTTYTCGSAGGKAVSLLPNDNGYRITKLDVGCARLPAVGAGRRKLSAAPGLGLSADKLAVTAVQVATVRDPPTVTLNAASLSVAATSLTIAGTGFDTWSPTSTTVALSLGGSSVANTVVVSSSTSLTVTFSSPPLPTTGSLTAVVSSFGLSSGSPVQVATVVVPSWSVVGPAGFSAGTALYTSLAIDSTGTPYVAYQDGGNGERATVQKFTSGSWSFVGTAGFSAGPVRYTSLAVDSTGTPYVAYQDGVNGYRATVQKFTSGSWSVVGTAGFSAGRADYTSLAIDSTGTPYVAYEDGGTGGRATVQKFTSGSWSVVGTAGFSASFALYTSLAIDSTGTPYVAYRDAGNSDKATVQKFTSGSWSVVGTAGFSAGTVAYTSLAIDSTGTSYVAYQDGGNGGRATVQKFTSGSWSVVGTAGFSAGIAQYTSLAIDSTGTPYVAYQDGGNGYRATVQKFTSGSWSVVGTAGFSAGTAYYTSLAIDSTGTPYVAYQDGGNGNKATVQNFGTPPTVTLNTAPLSSAATSLAIAGTGFDTWSPTSTTVALSLGGSSVANTVVVSSSTSLTVTFSSPPLPTTGSLTAVVSSFGLSSGSPVQVATVVVPLGSWSVMGTAGFSAGNVAGTSLAIDSTGTPYVAYSDGGNGNRATVQKFTSGSWSVVGTAGFSAGQASGTSLAIDSTGTPYVVYSDYGNRNRGKATVQKFTSGSWSVVGTAGFSAGFAQYTSLAIDSTGTPYVAYSDAGNRNKAYVQKFTSGSWSVVGGASFSAGGAAYTSLAIDSTGTPYVAYIDNMNLSKVTVQKFTLLGSWSVVGTVGFSVGDVVEYTSLAIDSTGTPYVAYTEGPGGGPFRATVQKFTSGSWSVVGTTGFSGESAAYPSLAIDLTGTPYVAYEDYGNGKRATVQKFTSGSWSVVGTAGFSAGIAKYTSLAIDSTGTPYVAYQDGGNGDKATVEQFF